MLMLPSDEHESAETSAIRQRLKQVLGRESNTSVAKRTGFHPETVRRYRLTGEMKSSFVAAVALQYEVNADWILTGRGSPKITLHDETMVAEYLRVLAAQLEQPSEEAQTVAD